MAIITKKFTNLANGKIWYARMYPVNGGAFTKRSDWPDGQR